MAGFFIERGGYRQIAQVEIGPEIAQGPRVLPHHLQRCQRRAAPVQADIGIREQKPPRRHRLLHVGALRTVACEVARLDSVRANVIADLNAIDTHAVEKRAMRYSGKVRNENGIQCLAVAPCRRASLGQLRQRLAQDAGQFFALQIDAVLPCIFHKVSTFSKETAYLCAAYLSKVDAHGG